MTILPRFQLIELHEQPWMPPSLRADLQLGITAMVRFFGLYKKVMPRIQSWLEEAQIDEILDLCSGAGGPARTLVEASLATKGNAPQIIVSDLYPQMDSLNAICAKYPAYIRCAPSPVDATNVGDIGRNDENKARARSMIACFHHFPPALCRGMLEDAISQRAPMLILEPMVRSLPALLLAAGISASVIPALRVLYGPTNLRTILRQPINAGQCVVDGVVSILRTYTPDEMHRMTDLPGSDYHWDIGIETGFGPDSFPLHKITYALGTPRERLIF